ncbi:MAG: hypothetical protein ACFFEY_07425 [Candidatus Thorarchaeota archaeon]
MLLQLFFIEIDQIIPPIIYIAFIIIFVYVIYRYYQDKDMILGIFVSAFFYGISHVNFSSIFHYLFFIAYVLFGFICGIPAGLISKNLKKGSLGGAIGVFLGTALLYPFQNFIIFSFETIHFLIQTLPLIIGGLLGGALGSKIIINYLKHEHPIIPKNSETEKRNNS